VKPARRNAGLIDAAQNYQVQGDNAMTERNMLDQTTVYYEELFALLDKRVDEADLDLSDVQVKSVIGAMYGTLHWRNETMLGIIDRFTESRGKARAERSDRFQKELEAFTANINGDFENQLWDMGLDLADEAVSAAVRIAREVLNYAQEDTSDLH
jgi:hypothetical protein